MIKRQGHSDGGKLIMDTYTEDFGSADDEFEDHGRQKSLPCHGRGSTRPPDVRGHCGGGITKSFRVLHQLDLKTSRAWHYKEDFRHFWNYRQPGTAERLYEAWRKAVMRSKLEPLKESGAANRRSFRQLGEGFEGL